MAYSLLNYSSEWTKVAASNHTFLHSIQTAITALYVTQSQLFFFFLRMIKTSHRGVIYHILKFGRWLMGPVKSTGKPTEPSPLTDGGSRWWDTAVLCAHCGKKCCFPPTFLLPPALSFHEEEEEEKSPEIKTI